MPSMRSSTPRYGRRASASSLDFTHWMLQLAESFTPRSIASQSFDPKPEDALEMLQIVSDCAGYVGILLPNSMNELRRQIASFSSEIDPLEAIHTRGALMFRGGSLVMSLGDRSRIMEVERGTPTVRHLNANEKVPGFWESAAKVPAMVYL